MRVELREAYFFRELTARELKRFEEVGVERACAAGETIVRVGEDVAHVFVVLEGQVRVIIPTESGGEAVEEVLARMRPGDCFGEFSFIDRKPASATIIADEATVVFRISHADLDPLLESDGALANKVLRAMLGMLVERIRSTAAELVLARYVARFV